MSQYDELDALIVAAIDEGAKQFFWIHTGSVRAECDRIAKNTGRESFRICDARMQALRRKGRIAFSHQLGWSTK